MFRVRAGAKVRVCEPSVESGVTLSVTFGTCVLLGQELPKCCQPLNILMCY